MLNKIGKCLLIGSGILLILIIVLSIKLDNETLWLPKPIFIIILFLSIVCFCISFSFIYFYSKPSKQKKAITVLSIISSVILVFGIISKKMWWAGASAEVIISIFLFCFGCLPLIIKKRYEKRKAILSKTALILSFTDLFAILFLCFWPLFKIMHWPGWPAMMPIGTGFLVISIFGWNASFKKEVNLKLEAEKKLKQTLKNLEEKNKLIEEKQKEILDSIKYAKRIQNAHLPNEKMITKTLIRLK